MNIKCQMFGHRLMPIDVSNPRGGMACSRNGCNATDKNEGFNPDLLKALEGTTAPINHDGVQLPLTPNHGLLDSTFTHFGAPPEMEPIPNALMEPEVLWGEQPTIKGIPDEPEM